MHSTFNNITNFINEYKNIISIAHNDNYLSPNSILISDLSHKKVQSIIINVESIKINNLTFKKNKLKTYDSTIKSIIEDPVKILNTVESFIMKNISELNSLSLAFLIDPKFENNFKTSFQKAYVKYIRTAWEEIKTGKLIQGVKKIKGSGLGLTPGGDDLITGMLYALILIEKIKISDTTKIRQSIYEAAAGKNDISRTMLYHANKGAYFKQFKELQNALINKNNETIYYLKNLIAVGETSGSDMLVGFLLSLKYFNKSKNDKRNN